MEKEERKRRTTTIVVSLELHNIIRMYARRRGLMVEGAVDKILRSGLKEELKKE